MKISAIRTDPRRSFLLMLLIIYIVSLPLISGISYIILEQYIPLHIQLGHTNKSLLIFSALYTVFFAVIFIVINHRFKHIYADIESGNKKIEQFSHELLDMNREMEDMVAERTLGMVSLRMADRIRNPIAVIGGITHRLMKSNQAEIAAQAGDIIEQCKRIEQGIAEFETLVKGKRFFFKSEDLNAIINNVAAAMQKAFDENGIELILEPSKTPPIMQANRRFLRLVINHLLDNAIEAMPNGGKITIKVTVDDNLITLTVDDTGEGIAPENLGRIFDPFFSTRRQIGLGLAFARQIIEEHLGAITVNSAVMEGTTFTVTFPRHWVDGGK